MLSVLQEPNKPAPRFALFDSRIDELQLPLVVEPSELDEIDEDDLKPLAPALRRFFEWTAVFEQGN
jgi:hypothetical protein